LRTELRLGLRLDFWQRFRSLALRATRERRWLASNVFRLARGCLGRRSWSERFRCGFVLTTSGSGRKWDHLAFWSADDRELSHGWSFGNDGWRCHDLGLGLAARC
jgi:hypothetical protein